MALFYIDHYQEGALRRCFRIIMIVTVFFFSLLSSTNAYQISVSAPLKYAHAVTDTITFECYVEFTSEESIYSVMYEIDYDDDLDETNDTEMYIVEGKQHEIKHIFSHVYMEGGYFDAVITITFTVQDSDGELDENDYEMDPITISVARWKYDADGTMGCIEAAPAVDDDETVYVGTERGCLHAVDSTGESKWVRKLDGAIHGASVLGEDRIYQVTAAGRLYILNMEGEILDIFPSENISAIGGFYATPALDTARNVLYIPSTDLQIYAVDLSSGELKWQFSTGGKNTAAPAIAVDGTVYVGSQDGFLYALSPEGELQWRKDLTASIYAGPSIDGDGMLYVGTCSVMGAYSEANGLWAISAAGNKRWYIENPNGFCTTPVIHSDGTIIAGSYDNYVYGYDRNGDSSWTFEEFGDDILCSGAVSSSNKLFVAGKDKMVYGLKVEENDILTGREIAWQYQMPHPVTTSAPVIGFGTVYMGTCDYSKGALYALAMGSDGSDASSAGADAPWPMVHQKASNTGETPYDAISMKPGILAVDPENASEDLDIERTRISATFSESMDPESVTDDLITIPTLNLESTEYTISWNVDYTVLTLTLPSDVSFGKNTKYTAEISGELAASIMDEEDKERTLLSTYEWTFSKVEETEVEYGGGNGCFVTGLFR